MRRIEVELRLRAGKELLLSIGPQVLEEGQTIVLDGVEVRSEMLCNGKHLGWVAGTMEMSWKVVDDG